MGIYNIIGYRGSCPHCETTRDFEVQVKFGFCDVFSYAIGDEYRWLPEGDPPLRRHEPRPPRGDLDGSGWAECPVCDEDFFVVVDIRNDVIMRVVVDKTRPGLSSGGDGRTYEEIASARSTEGVPDA